MPRDFSRTDRIGEQIQRDLAELIRLSLKDPRLGMITVNSVDVSKDLGYADVYVTLLTVEDLSPESEEVRQTIRILNGAAGFLRKELGRMIKLRTIPQLRFHFDASVGRGRKLDDLINRARKKDAALHRDESEEQSDKSDTDRGGEA